MEKEIFNWKYWDEQDIGVFCFIDVTFIKDFGKFKKDEKFDAVVLDYSKSELRGYDKDGITITKKENIVLAIKN